jgi:hypothetical protein
VIRGIVDIAADAWAAWVADSENAMARRWPSAPASAGWRLGNEKVF